MEQKKTHWKKAFKSPYIGAWDLDDYEDLTLTVKKVECKMSKGLKDNETMNIATFEEKGFKPMILNSTNSQTMKILTGSNYVEDWKDIQVTLYVLENIKAFGGLHDGLRIRSKTVVSKKKNELPLLEKGSEKWNSAIKGIEAGTVTAKQIQGFYTVGAKDLIELKTIKKK